VSYVRQFVIAIVFGALVTSGTSAADFVDTTRTFRQNVRRGAENALVGRFDRIGVSSDTILPKVIRLVRRRKNVEVGAGYRNRRERF
jgi:hypothetical protein